MGTDAEPGTGDVWAINPLVTQEPGSGEYNAQGVELDFNNNNVDRGDADAGAGLAPPVSYGFSVTGAGAKRSTSAILVSGPGAHPIWNRGITFANNAISESGSAFQDICSGHDKSIDIRGNPKYALYQTSTASINHLAGKSGVGHHTVNQLNDSLAKDAIFSVAGPVHIQGAIRRESPARHDGESSRALIAGLSEQQEVSFHGKVTADATGSVSVSLHESIGNLLDSGLSPQEATVHLTPVGAPMPLLHVATELLTENTTPHHFEVGGAAANGKVHWRVSLRCAEVPVKPTA